MSTFERHVLDNGLRVLTANLPYAQSVTCMVMLAAGSRRTECVNAEVLVIDLDHRSEE